MSVLEWPILRARWDEYLGLPMRLHPIRAVLQSSSLRKTRSGLGGAEDGDECALLVWGWCELDKAQENAGMHKQNHVLTPSIPISCSTVLVVGGLVHSSQ